MNNKDKIIIVTHNHDRLIDVLAKLSSINEEIKIAKTFSTNIMQKDLPIQAWKYYMDNDNLYLAYKNNALLCVTTSNDQISEGITKEEAVNSSIIPMTYSMFNMSSSRTISGISIAWIDSSSDRSKSIIKETAEFMQVSKKYPLLYFTDEDTVSDIANIIIRYLRSDDIIRNNIIKDCN